MGRTGGRKQAFKLQTVDHVLVSASTIFTDLFYRIQVFPIVLPPLRERIEDIPLLASHFFEKFAKKLNKPQGRLSPRALQVLMQYDWPGNVRELENEIERALTLAGDDREIKAEYISGRMKASGGHASPATGTQVTLQEATAQLERQMVVKALRKTDGNRSQAARILGLTRQGLLNKIARYNIRM